jgi:hypothetical protein
MQGVGTKLGTVMWGEPLRWDNPRLAHLPFNRFSFLNYRVSLRLFIGWRSGSGLWWRPTRRGIASRRLIETIVLGNRFRPVPLPFLIPHRIERSPHALKKLMVAPLDCAAGVATCSNSSGGL